MLPDYSDRHRVSRSQENLKKKNACFESKCTECLLLLLMYTSDLCN